jgi:hypothetical protein
LVVPLRLSISLVVDVCKFLVFIVHVLVSGHNLRAKRGLDDLWLYDGFGSLALLFGADLRKIRTG